MNGAAPQQKLRRDVGLWEVVLIAIGNTIGGGIFVLLSQGTALAGIFLPVSFLLGAFLAFLISLVYAEIASSVSRAGSGLVFTFRAFGEGVFPFTIVWLIFLGDLAYGAINALAFAFYANSFLSVGATGLIAAIAVLCITAFHMRGAQAAGKVEAVISFVLLALLGAFAFLAARRGGFVPAVPSIALSALPIVGIISGTALTFSTFIGFEDIATLAEEIRQPQKNIPRALMYTVFLAAALYLTITIIAVSVVPHDVLIASDVPLLAMAEYLGGGLRFIIMPAAILATLASLLASVLICSRDLYAISREGFFPKFLQRMGAGASPYWAVLCAGALLVFFIFIGSVEFMAYLSTTTYFIMIAAAASGVLVMRKKRPFLARPFIVPHPLIPVGTVVFSLAILFFVDMRAIFWTLVWAGIGFFVFLSSFIEKERIQWMALGGAVVLAFLFSVLFWVYVLL